MLPYVYRLENPITGEIYIGYREAKKLPSHLDLPDYKTSAPKITNTFGEFNPTIVAEFFLGDDAYDHEQLCIFEEWDNPLLLNESCFHNAKGRFRSSSPDVKIKIIETKLGIPIGKYFNNGICNIRLKETDLIPIGFVKGKLLSSKASISVKKFNAAGQSKESRIKATNTMKKENRPEGFIHGNVGKSKAIWISNMEKKLSTMIKVSEEIPEGWIRGRKFSKVRKTQQPKKKFIHNPISNKRAKILINEEIPEGWFLGTGIKPSDESNEKRREYSSNRMWITNEYSLEETMVKKDSDIPIGWIKGSLKIINRKDPLTGQFK